MPSTLTGLYSSSLIRGIYRLEGLLEGSGIYLQLHWMGLLEVMQCGLAIFPGKLVVGLAPGEEGICPSTHIGARGSLSWSEGGHSVLLRG